MVLLNSALLNPNPGLVIWQLIVFGILVFILRKFAWTPIINGLKEREGEIEGALKMAEETRAEMAKLKADNDKLVAEARRERDEIVKEAKEAANRLIAEAKADAQTQSAKILEDARATIAHEKEVMIASVKQDVANLSIEIAEKILRKELSDKAAQQSYVSALVADAKLN
ncbi:F0F1 ATP synthase subunit B [Leadbetterella byssophila]|uniref:ATP synthase subunit b n=1 Tax=Leadbetterella byssophila (strain DSM 17132 / JCM 16389 / KACC 11308 / NBRC 106382 / 4M15) TaxID=649349 RepID=E4RZW6_LEAB4|nr:F0F1 ATP synthase subunit B [Leadbetterella byssophila]ADQ19258.1 ATP synthase F0 subcomplex B subunit [Leadbetterella byssophila DSM 17132]